MNLNIKLINNKGIKKTLILNTNMTIAEAKEKAGEKHVRWTFNGAVLDDNKTLSYYELEDGNVIASHGAFKGGGPSGFGLNTIDISKNNTRIIEFDNSAPYYRYVCNGLNIQAICGNDCEAKDKIVYCKIGFVRDYNIFNNLENIKCPACGNEIYPKNFGFLSCKYKIDYTKWENNKKQSGTVEGEAGSEFKIFSEYSGNANFSKLVFNVTQQ